MNAMCYQIMLSVKSSSSGLRAANLELSSVQACGNNYYDGFDKACDIRTSRKLAGRINIIDDAVILFLTLRNAAGQDASNQNYI